MSITFGGLASGLDTNALIDGLMGVEALPLNRNRAKQTDLGIARDTISSFLNKIASIKTKAATLDTDSEFASFKSTVSGTGVVATTTGTALAGSYSVSVNKLAKETRMQSDAFADPAAALGMAGDLEITVGGSAMISVSVSATDSLANVAAAINSSDARVNASVIFDGTQHRLLVRGADTGSANQVTIAETGSAALGLSTPANTYQNAQNAEIVLDGQFTISRSTNKFADIVPGVTLTATEVTASPLTLVVEPDTDAQASKIQEFITAYNEGISAGHLAAGFGTIGASNKNLAGDSAVRTTLDRLAGVISNPVSGLSGKYNMLAAVGVSLTQDGTLKLDRTKLDAALNDDPDAVAKVFVGDSANNVEGIMSKMVKTVEGLAEGNSSVLNLRKGVFESGIERLETDALDLERRLGDYETRLRKQFTDLEILISQIQQQGNGLAGFTSFTKK